MYPKRLRLAIRDVRAVGPLPGQAPARERPIQVAGSPPVKVSRGLAAGWGKAVGPGSRSRRFGAAAAGPEGVGVEPTPAVVGGALRWPCRIEPVVGWTDRAKLLKLAGSDGSFTPRLKIAPAAETAYGPAVISPTLPKDVHGRGLRRTFPPTEPARSACVSAACYHRVRGTFRLAGNNAWPREPAADRRRVVVPRYSAYTRCSGKVKKQSQENRFRRPPGRGKSNGRNRLRLDKKIERRSLARKRKV